MAQARLDRHLKKNHSKKKSKSKTRHVVKKSNYETLLKKYRERGYHIVKSAPHKYKGKKSQYRGKEVITYAIVLQERQTKARGSKRYSSEKDKKMHALPPGLRIVIDPETGKIIGQYYEYSRNRTDLPNLKV